MFDSPDYYVIDFKIKQRDIQALFDLLCEKNIKLVIDDQTPMKLNAKNVNYLFEKSVAQKAHGKLIISFGARDNATDAKNEDKTEEKKDD